MISLVGEQPVPSLLPIRHLVPDEVALIHTHASKKVSDNLRPLLEKSSRVIPFEVTAYDILKIKKSLDDFVSSHRWQPGDLTFNLTGGTKPMSLAAFQLAQELRANVAYLQSEGGRSLLYTYVWREEQLALHGRQEISPLLSIDDFLRCHGLGDYKLTYSNSQNDFGGEFETAVFRALKSVCDEVVQGIRFLRFPHVELDFIFRIGNQIGIGEAKTGVEAGKKNSIDQLNSATHREFLGTYTRKFLFMNGRLTPNNRKLIDAYRINAVELNEPLVKGSLGKSDRKKLAERISKSLSS